MLMKNTKKLIAVLLVTVIMFAFTACANKKESPGAASTVQPTPAQTETQSATMKKVKESGKLVLGTSADYPPFEFHKSINGKDEIVGMDIEIAKEIAKDLGVQLEIKDMAFDGLLAAMVSGNIDLVIAGMEASPERKQSVDFSKSYFQSDQTIMIRKADADKIKSLADLKDKKIGVQKSSKQEGIVKDQIPEAKAVGLGKLPDIVMALKNDKVDAFLIDRPVSEAYIKANDDLMIADIEIVVEDAGAAIAVRKDSQDMVDIINNTIDRLTAAGSIDKFFVDNTNLMEE